MSHILSFHHTVAQALALAWAGGFADGEGCIYIAKQEQLGRKNPTYRPRLDISQNNLAVLVRLREILDENSGLYAVKCHRSHRHQPYTLVYDGEHALRAVAKLRPYLIRKAVEADVLLTYPELASMGIHPGPRGYAHEVWTERERIYRRLQDLKRPSTVAG